MAVLDPGHETHMTHIVKTDEFWMEKALKLAHKAELRGEVPIGALLVRHGKRIASSGNRRETLPSPIGHAELLVLHKAALLLNSWRLLECTLYVTLEPCVMCAGALVQARVPRLVYGATDPKGGGVKSLYQICEDPRLNHRLEVTSGVLAEPCGEILKQFFRKRRTQ